MNDSNCLDDEPVAQRQKGCRDQDPVSMSRPWLLPLPVWMTLSWEIPTRTEDRNWVLRDQECMMAQQGGATYWVRGPQRKKRGIISSPDKVSLDFPKCKGSKPLC